MRSEPAVERDRRDPSFKLTLLGAKWSNNECREHSGGSSGLALPIIARGFYYTNCYSCPNQDDWRSKLATRFRRSATINRWSGMTTVIGSKSTIFGYGILMVVPRRLPQFAPTTNSIGQ